MLMLVLLIDHTVEQGTLPRVGGSHHIHLWLVPQVIQLSFDLLKQREYLGNTCSFRG